MLKYNSKRGRQQRVEGIQFSILSEEEVVNQAVVEVKDSTIYCKGLPHVGGINDHRMGICDRRIQCGVCGKGVTECSGHTGVINLPFPCYHVGFLDTNLKILRSVCFFCCKLLSTPSNSETGSCRKSKLLQIHTQSKMKKKCPLCNAPCPSYTKLNYGINIEWDPSADFECEEEKVYATQSFTAKMALSILSNVRQEDYADMGIDSSVSHPKDTILNHLLVPPVVARPAFMASEGSQMRGQDDLSSKLQEINKRCIDLRRVFESIGWDDTDPLCTSKLSESCLEKLQKLQIDVFGYMNSSSVKGKTVTTKSISDRLKGKEGRIRGNLMGKRVDFSARSVITPDPNMDVDQVGVPHTIAVCLTVPERVNTKNLFDMKVRIRNGYGVLNGAETIIKKNGVVIELSQCSNRSNIDLRCGDVVERYLKDDDVVVFNRQPSLHKMSAMGHRVKLMKGKTFRLNLSCANPYNADFDGDEMNMHVPQSICSQTEVGSIMIVSEQIISPQACKPVMGIVQDSLVGCYLLTADDVFLEEFEVLNILCKLKYEKRILPPTFTSPKNRWSGKHMFSMLLPDTFYLKKEDVLIECGILKKGRMTKATLGSSVGGIIEILFRDYGATRTIHFMSDVQRMANKWLVQRGFSVGISDCVPEDGKEEIKATIKSMTNKLESLVEETKPVLPSSEIEPRLMQLLSQILMRSGTMVKEKSKNNSILSMVQAGSKGSPINLSQICACVAQQSLEGSRIPVDEFGRSLSYFDWKDDSLASRGFIKHSYASGLDPHEYFFHSIAGREGLVDTAVKTSVTGYIQRRAIKGMEDNRVAYDGTIRNAEQCIVSLRYGGDDFNASKIERQFFPFNKPVHHHKEWFGEYEDEYFSFVQTILPLRKSKTQPCIFTLDTQLLLPINLPRRFMKEKKKTDINQKESEDWSDEEKEDIRRIKTSFLNFLEERKMCLSYKMYVMYYLCTENVIRNKIPPSSLKKIVEECIYKTKFSIVQSGEMVGAIAAQSVGEPCTQLTLNTFHHTGVSTKNVTLGIPRLREILDNSKKIRTPSNTLYFKHPFHKNEDFVTYIANTLPMTLLTHLILKVDMQNGSDDFHMNIMYKLQYGEELEGWMVRAVLNKQLMRDRCISPGLLKSILRWCLPEYARFVVSDFNSVDSILLLKFTCTERMVKGCGNEEAERVLVQNTFADISNSLMLSGHPSIRSASCRKVTVWNEDKECDEDEFVVDTRGVSLFTLASIPSLDWERSYSNDVNEILDILGIEATVKILINQINEVISFDGTYVNSKHISMLVDSMTHRGYIMALSRHGINRTSTGPLVRCSFEETIEVLYEASLFSEMDCGRGVTHNIMTGQTPMLGTGSFDVMLPSNVQTGKRIVKSSVSKKVAVECKQSYQFVETKAEMGIFRALSPR